MKYSGINKIIQSESLQKYLDKIADGTFRDFIDDWKWIFSYTKRYKWIVVFYTVLGLLSSTLGVASSYVSSMMINIITGKQTDKLPLFIAVTLGTTAFSLIFNSIMSRVSTKISIYVNNDIQGEIFDRIVDVKWAELNKYKNGDILNRFNSDVGTVSGNAIAWIPNILVNIYTFIITFIVLYRMDHIMAWIGLFSAPFLFIMSHYILRKQREYRKKVLELNSNMMSFEMESFYNMDTVKAFGVWGSLSKRLREWQKKFKLFNLDYNMFQIKTNIAMSIISTVVTFGSFGYCLYRLWTGQILYGDMTFFLGQRSTLTSRFNALVSTIPSMLNSAVSAHRIRELVDLPKEEHNPAVFQAVQSVADKGLSIELNNVTFSYSDGQKVYENAVFTARPGEIVAVLGESGGGKTTLFRLLLGLVQPDEGQVLLRDTSGNAVTINADLRQFVSYVPQGNTMMMGTIAENMHLVKEDATDDEIINALKIACAWEFVEPIGINGVLGERGKGISEGQAQRISIARALLRNAPILFLDEATSALDEATEARVIDNVVTSSPNRTVIVSTHRPSVLKKCKRIYRITDKKIEEEKEE